MIFAFYCAIFLAVSLQLASNAYLLLAMIQVRVFGRRSESISVTPRPVTVLVPICGLDDGLYENLQSICRQDYADYQIVIGIQDADDPAINVVRKLMAEFTEQDITLVIDARTSGANLKVSNLCNMYSHAKHPILVTLDSDMRVRPNYLASIEAPLRDPKTGIVTCLYKGVPAAGLPSILGSMFINEWFLPSVLVATNSRRDFQYCFGATMAFRREVLDEIGGFQSLVEYLADDYMLGKKIKDLGYRIHLSRYLVENIVNENSLKSLFFHELRWARTVRAIQPIGYYFSFIMYPLPLAIFAAWVNEWTFDKDFVGFGLIVIALSMRIVTHYVIRHALQLRNRSNPLLVPIRDVMSLVVWACGLFGRDVEWRGQVFSIGPRGLLFEKG